MKLLVAGGAGFIGSHVVDVLTARGHDVLVVDNLSSGHKENLAASAVFIHLDLLERERLAKLMAVEHPDAVIHLAAQKSVGASVEDPIMDAEQNVIASLNLLEAARNAGTRKIVFASTGGALYGDTDQLPTDERHLTLPESPYGISKLAVEHYLRFYTHIHGFQTVSLRMANVYGPRQDPLGEAGVVAIFCRRALDGEPVTFFGDGLQTRDYTYVKDAAMAFALAVEQDQSLTVNIGTGVETSLVDLVGYLEVVEGHPIARVMADARPGEIRRSCLDAREAGRRLGWKASFTIEEGLAQTLDSFRGSR